MRERTPSADDTPKRAPPAPSREAVLVAGSETPNDDTIEVYRTAKLPVISSVSGATSSSDRMVASLQSLEDLAVNHPANAAGSNGDRQQQQQERYGHAYKSSAQTAQDKRSRLSNVINNLRKKVPDGIAKGNAESPRKEEDDRNSVERNLETLEKYVMTVLNGVIKDDEEEDKGKSVEKTKEPERRIKDADEEENPTDMTVKSDGQEPSNEGDIEAAVVPCLEDSSTVENADSSKIIDCSNIKGAIEESIEVSEVKISQDSKELSSRTEEEHLDVDKEESSESDTSREKKENRTLGTIIMDRLSEHQVEERANVDDGRGEDPRDEHVISENVEVRAICMELLDELLNDVYLTIDKQKSQQRVEECEKMKELIDTTESRIEESKDSNAKAQESTTKSLHCSLPLDKVAFVLQNCQTGESMTSRLSSGSPSNPPSTQKSKSSSCTTPPVRLLCLYCDRKFLSISLRQRHTERVHQLGGRRSERNSRKPSQNCQYCSERCADTLETLFQHMISNHGDKYHACVQCLTRYPTREALMGHMSETHGGNTERSTIQVQPEKIKEGSPCKEFCNREKVNVSTVRERRSEEKELETSQGDSRQSDSTRTKLITTRDSIDNPASPEFDSSFYSNVSCNIRENLLHHLDGKLQTIGGSSSCASSITVSGVTTTLTESKSQQQQQPPQQSYYEHSVNQIQFPIDISLTAATPVYSKDYSAGEEHENSSEYARKAGKTSSGSRPRRVSFEKYNFPRKYDGREQWTCSIKDLSKFDISTQLSLRKKQQLIKERLTISRLHQIPLLSCETTEVSLHDREQVESVVETAASSQDNVDGGCSVDAASATLDVVRCDPGEPPSEIKKETTTEESTATSSSCSMKSFITTEFTIEFSDFMRLRRREQSGNEAANIEEIIYAELSGEWSRTRIYICGACGSRHITLKEMEDHKASTHPRVLCSHFELTDDQREHYKHLYLPGQSAPTDEARDEALAETVCTKCTKSCLSVAELHRHMLECGGDHAWLLGLTGSGKRKCKWRPFGSRSRRRRQRGMKRNIQNSQTQPRIVNAEQRPKEKQTPTGPRVRPSDRESIQKMLANLPAKRATRKVLQDNAMRSQGKLRNVQTRTRPRIIGDNSSVSRISRNKAALRNKLLKNAKSIQRNRCRSDNITAVIESVVKKCHETEKRLDGDGNRNTETEDEDKKDSKETNEVFLAGKALDSDDKVIRPKVVGRPKLFGKKGNMKTKTSNSSNNSQFQDKDGDKLANLKAKGKSAKFKSSATSSETKGDAKGEETSSPKNTPKNSKTTSRTADKYDISPGSKRISTVPGIRGKSKSTQGTLKRKRSVDPTASSLKASLKAKSQLRTQDGKFARNPNKESSAKSSELKMDDGKHKAVNSLEIKLLKTMSKTIQKLKKAEVRLPRRITRLSSDSDKMPTLEPVVQIVSSNEEYADKSTNDLPILSPVTSGSLQDQKTLRTSAKYVLKEKEGNTEANTDREVAPEKSTKEQKPTRGRKPKQEPKDTAKRKEVEIVGENEISKNSSMMLKERRARNRKGLHIKNINNGENSKEETSKGEAIAKKDSKPKKEETTKETRSNSRTKIEKDSMKLPDIPFEVKKLLGSASKEDLLNTLEIASNDTGSKRNLRQSTPRSKTLQASDKNPRELDDELDSSKGTGKREKIEAIRKSSRKNVEKKDDEKMVKTINLEKDSTNNAIAKATNNLAQNERSQQNKRDNRANAKTKEIDSTDIEDKIDSRQTRRSLIDARSESSSEVASGNSQKGSGLSGKRRSRNKSVDEAEETNTHAIQEQNNSENVTPSEEEAQKKEEFEEAIDKNETEGDGNNSDDRDSMMVNLSLSHLQSETSNLSVDSGKENSLETSMNVHNKLKVARPKKTWGARRERSSRKRSLNNVIGILTEGINIPVEQSVQVLTVQTSLDNPDRVTRNGSAQQPVGGEDNVIADVSVDSAFSELSVLARNEQESAENEVIATNADDNHRADDEKNARPCIDNAQDENAFTDQTDVSSKVSTAKVHSPANDIILDLSRRKPKGKGSFLEKIVSKIAKQKDALLVEGEVGSLLDNAADELTSILNEVGPALADNAECANFGEVSYASKNENNENITSTSSEKPPIIATSENRSLENDITNIKNAASERSTDLLMIQDNLEENLATRIQSKNQIKVNDVSDVEIKDNYVVDRQVSDTMRRSVDKSQVESCENKSATNEEAIIPMEIPDETPSSLTDTLTEISISSITTQKLSVEKFEKKESGVKSRRKSSKRSLEDASWPKKSKRKSLEVVEELAEKNMQKELRLDDIIASIPKQKDTFNVGHELVEEEGETMKISKIDAEGEKFQHSESKTIKDLELSSLEKIFAEDDESNLEKFANLPEAAYEEANELTANLEEAVDKIFVDREAVEANYRAIELIEKSIEFSTLSLKKTVKSEKSTDRTKKKNQTEDASESSYRRTSKRKSQSLSDVLQTSVKPINEKLLSRKEDSVEFTGEKSMKVETINENLDASLEKSLYTMQTTSNKREETQNADNLTSSKTTKKHGTKKKSLADEHLALPEDESAEVASKFNEESNVADSNEQLSASLEHFKVPEVKDLLQSVKKRGPRKKLLPEDNRCNGESVSEEPRINEELAEVGEMSNLIEKVEEQVKCKKHIVREQSSMKKLERSTSSGSIGLTPSLVKTRSMFKKKTQLSSEDLAVSSIRSQDAESTDDLSESSCVSESSYFRKKRFAKRKKKEENIAGDNERTDSIVLKSDKENSNKKMQKAKSLLDEHLDLSDVDDIDIPMDIQASLENTKALENIERQFELAEKSVALENEDADDKPVADESAKEDATTEQSVSNNYDSPDDPITPKKRAAGNFVVVHTKTGEILIVEKRKKLTKEAARFFCDVCATSFTRKSSLKKHTLSQSHLSQMTKSTKDKIESINNSTSENAKEIDDKEKSDQVSDRDAKSVSDDARSHEVTQNSLESNESYAPYGASTESLVNLGVTRQETLEDKLLDEEICKITENMSHDEYVLTDQVTPEEPMSSSTPIKQIQKKQEESGRGRNGEKKRNKSKKKNLAEEHLLLDSPGLEESKFDSNELLNSVNNLVRNSSSPSCEHSSTKEMVQTVKETKDVPEEIQLMDSAETKKEVESIVKSLNDEIDCSKLSLCDTDMKDEQHMESTRTTRSALRKSCKIDNDRKEENETSTEMTRFSLRPRRSKNIIQHYEESDVEADIYFMDVSLEINNDEIENSYDPQKRQNETEEEMSKDALQEMTHADIKNKNSQEVAEVAKSKSDSINDTKKRKRGRPRLKDRIISNSSVTSTHAEVEVNENNVVATSSFEESKIKDQKLISHTKERLDEVGKPSYIDANIQPPKRSRGRPRKNPVQIANNFLIQAEDSSVSESMKSKCNEVREETGQIESEMLLSEEAASITLVNSLASNVESLPAGEDHIRESNLSETKRDGLKVEENGIRFTKVNTSDNQSVQKVESTNKIADTILVKDCDMLSFNVSSEENKAVDTLILSERNEICADDAKYTSENKSDYNDTSANILTSSTAESLAEFSSQIIEKEPTTTDDLKSIESIRTIGLESFEIQKLPNISEEERTKSGEEVEIFQEETKLVSESEDSEDEVTDDKSLPITNPRELLVEKTIDDLENDSVRDKRTTRLESSSKRLSGSSQSAGKERETSRRKSKASRSRRKKVIVAKVAELSSDSENEVDRIESASSSKSKIVKSVFGRVLGGEKADKVKEVLNDWVSRSEDDSDISRSASEARSCLRGPTKISENGHKKKRHSGILTSSDTKKDAEPSPRKKGNDKGNNIEVHGKLKNRKKREKDLNTMPEDRIESLSPVNPAKRRHRESKIRADERILRTFDDESLILSEGDEDVNEIKETSSQFDDDYLSNKDDELGRYHEEEWNEERTKDRNSISADWENLRLGHDAYGKSKNSSSYRKKQDTNARNERSSSPSQFNMFKCRRRESKTKAGERIWKALDNETSSCLSDDQDLNETRKNFKERESGFHESRDVDRPNNSKSVKHKDDDTWKDTSLINQEQIEAQNIRGRSRKDSNNRKKQNFNAIGIGKTKTDNMISKNSDNDSSIALRNQKTEDETQNEQTTRSTSESRNRPKNLTVKDNTYESFADINHQSTNSRKSKKGTANEDWKRSMKSLEYDQEDLAKDDQLMEKEIRHKHEVSAMLSRSCSNLAGPTVKDQFADLDGNSQAIRESDNDDNNDEEEEQEDDDDDDDNDLGRRRMSPFYACEISRDSSIDSSSNNEEDEDEDGEEDEEERMTHEDTSRKTNPSEFSGEKIVIRSPSSGHRSDVVTIAPTDAIEDNALDVPREIESTTEPRQGKILNFDEELFVECCSRLKATSENELRGAKKIKLDHTESYHRRDDQPQGFRVNRDRWRDVESQNSLGSLLESVNQLLGEEMCNSYDRSYRTRGSEQSSRSASPDASRVDNLGYEDSLDVAFQHNNKLRDKIQQRMRESENLIASTFGQKIDDNDHPGDDKRGSVGNSYSSSIHEHEQLSTSIATNRERAPSPGHKNKVNSTLGGLLDKALSNLLHSNGKHDHNGSAPMKLLAELACARAPTSTSPEDTTNSGKNHQSVKMVAAAVAAAAAAAATATKDTSDLSKKPTKGSTVTSKTSPMKKTRNPIKELFERKKEINDRKEQERSKATLELNVQKSRKPKRGKKQQQQEFPLIRRNELYGGLMEKKKRRDSFDRKGESERIKDVYEFDEEESQIAPTLGSVMSYRSQVDKSYETNWPKKDIDGDLGAALENGKTNYIADTKLDAIIDRKFQELEKFAPKTKGALKSFQSEEQQQQQQVADAIIGPMDDFVERKHQRLKRLEQSVKQPSKLKKRGKSPKKRTRNAWYENDSSDEFRTAAKAEDVGVGISKSQRACSKGKQNLFAESSTSSESEYEREDDVDYAIANEQQPPSSRSRKSLKKQLDIDIDEMNCDQHIIKESKFDNEDQIANCDWQNQVAQKNAIKKDYDVAKSESEMSDRSLVIDERKTIDEARNSDDDADNQYERTFELEDLYREDSSETETEIEGNDRREEPTPTAEEAKDRIGTQALDDENATLQTNVKDDYAPENELIPLEEALDFLDRHEKLEKSENIRLKVQIENDSINGTIDSVNEASNDGIINMEKENNLDHTEAQDEKEEPDDDVPALPEKLSSNEKPQKESDNNLPLHVFLSRKVQESKKRKQQQQLDKLREEQERILMDFQPTRRQRKCAIGKQGLLAEISSSDEESYARDNSKRGHDHDKSRKKRELKEKRKERYLEKKHEQMIAKEQKAIEEEILREVGKRKILAQSIDVDIPALNIDAGETKLVSGQVHKKKYQSKEKQRKSGDENSKQHTTNQSPLGSSEDIRNNLKPGFPSTESTIENNGHLSISSKRKKLSKSPARLKKIPKLGENGKIPASKRNKESTAEKCKKTSASNNKDSKERRSSSGKRDSDDEELKTTKSWNKVEEGVGVAIGRRKRTAAHQLYYWSSSSDEEEAPEPVLMPEEEEDDRQEQHGWIVGDSHKRMITMLAMEKQQKEKRRRSEDEFESGKTKSKKHRNSTS